MLYSAEVVAAGWELVHSVCGRGCRFELFVVEIEGVCEFAVAGSATWEAKLKVVCAGLRHGDGSGPADGEGLSGGVCGFDGVGRVPVKVDLLVGTGEGGSAVEAGAGEVFGGEAFSVGRGAEEGARDGEFAVCDVG